MHTHLNFGFKQALHFSILAIKLFNSGDKVVFMNQSSLKCFAAVRHTHF